MDMGSETGCVCEARKPTQVASQRGCREGKADDKRVSASPRHRRY